MIRRWFWGLLSLFLVTSALQGQSRESVLQAVAQNSKWSPADKPIQYDQKNIETLAGKRAATINHYGFVGVTMQNWSGPNGNLRLTLYEMADASAAYGLFTLERSEQPGAATVPVGTEGFRAGNRLLFWQSKYLVKLEGGAVAADSLARVVSENILGRSWKPPVSNHLPPENLVRGSDKYIVDEKSIGREFELNPKTLGFDDSVEVATADYRINGKNAHLVLLLYPTQQLAKKYEDQWANSVNDRPELRKRVGPLVALVRGSRDPSVAKSILDGVNYESQVTWDQPRPDLSLRQVILTIFTFIGIALLFTAVAGLSFGGLRVFVKAKYPDRVFDRTEDMEIIQLKLGQGVIHKELGE
ncbi:MAG TPA: DUF6599 family protein [Terriglobia bacterium]|nr:DUF6599 family protein [Terriglobia bacterium]